MRHYLYRLKKEEYEKIKDTDRIEIDYLLVEIDKTDRMIVFVSGSLRILGAYRKIDGFLAAEKPVGKEMTLREFYGRLSIVREICPRSYKVFAKKIREITKDDYKTILEAL